MMDAIVVPTCCSESPTVLSTVLVGCACLAAGSSAGQTIQLMLAHCDDATLLLASTAGTYAAVPARRSLLAAIEGISGTLSTTVVSGESSGAHLLMQHACVCRLSSRLAQMCCGHGGRLVGVWARVLGIQLQKVCVQLLSVDSMLGPTAHICGSSERPQQQSTSISCRHMDSQIGCARAELAKNERAAPAMRMRHLKSPVQSSRALPKIYCLPWAAGYVNFTSNLDGSGTLPGDAAEVVLPLNSEYNPLQVGGGIAHTLQGYNCTSRLRCKNRTPSRFPLRSKTGPSAQHSPCPTARRLQTQCVCAGCPTRKAPSGGQMASLLSRFRTTLPPVPCPTSTIRRWWLYSMCLRPPHRRCHQRHHHRRYLRHPGRLLPHHQPHIALPRPRLAHLPLHHLACPLQ